MDLSILRAFARGELNEDAIQELADASNAYDLSDTEVDSDMIQEACALAYPMIIQSAILGEGAEALEEAASETFTKLQDYLVGQGVISEAAAVSVGNPRINVVHLNKEAQINRLRKMFILMLARKDNNKNYKKYKLGCKLKKDNMPEMEKRYGTKADRLAKKAYQEALKGGKVKAAVDTSKKNVAKKIVDTK